MRSDAWAISCGDAAAGEPGSAPQRLVPRKGAQHRAAPFGTPAGESAARPGIDLDVGH
jgi:hypothetical protein